MPEDRSDDALTVIQMATANASVQVPAPNLPRNVVQIQLWWVTASYCLQLPRMPLCRRQKYFLDRSHRELRVTSSRYTFLVDVP